MQVLYLAGPGNIYGTYKKWKNNDRDNSQFALTYSQQFFNSIRSKKIKGVVISWDINQDEYEIESEEYVFINKYLNDGSQGALKFYIGQIKYVYYIYKIVKKYKIDLIVSTGGIKWFLLYIFKLMEKKIIISLHNLIWPKKGEEKFTHRLITKLNQRFINNYVDAALSISTDTTEQLKEILKKDKCRIIEFAPSFYKECFEDMNKKNINKETVNILFSGRVEREKGVFDLVEIIDKVKKGLNKEVKIKVDMCGSGSDFKELKNYIVEKKMEEIFNMHGQCKSENMKSFYENADIVIVPTRSKFSEGFNKVVIEGVLSGATVIASDVCTLDVFKSKKIYGVEANNIEQYISILSKILENNELYDNVSNEDLEFFTNYNNSWEYAFREGVLSPLLEKNDISERFIYNKK